MLTYYATLFVSAWICMIASIPYMGSPLAASRVIFPFMRISLNWTDIECEVRGEEHLASDTAYVLVANHQSSLDIVPMSHVWPNNCIVMMKRSLRYVPGFNVAAWLAGSVFVDRSNRSSAIQSVTSVTETIRSRHVKVWVFPEGTRNHETVSMLPFKKGAFHMAVQAGIY
jgi:lysophosphatidate acyltransferase